MSQNPQGPGGRPPAPTGDRAPLACRVFGHRWRFAAEDATMRWACQRGCGAQGEKRYASPEDARRYARAFDREDRSDVGRRPLLSLLPVGLARRFWRHNDKSP